MSYRLLPCLALCLCTMLLSACGNLPGRPGPSGEEPPEKAQELVEEVADEGEAAPMTQRTVDDDVQRLLATAEAALAADRLTTPYHDNAFDRFQAVLLLRPDNKQARSGLQQILVRYVAMIRGALARNDPASARSLVWRAQIVDYDHPIWEELKADIEAAEQRLAAQAAPASGDQEKEIPLDARSLDRRADSLVEELQKLARELRESEESLLIVARNDAEGRWIYQRMSEAVPNYRLRGDIRVGREPKIVVLPPIE